MTREPFGEKPPGSKTRLSAKEIPKDKDSDERHVERNAQDRNDSQAIQEQACRARHTAESSYRNRRTGKGRR